MRTISERVEAISKRAEGRFDVSYADSVELPPPLAEIATAGMQLKRVNFEIRRPRGTPCQIKKCSPLGRST